MSHEHVQYGGTRDETRLDDRGESGRRGRVSQDQDAHSDGGRAEIVGRAGETGDVGRDAEGTRRPLIAQASYWSGAVPSPEDMAAFKTVDPSFPERIMRMTEQTVDTQNRSLAETSQLESWAVTIASVGYTVLPWVVALVFGLTGHDVAATVSAVAGLAQTGPKIVSAIKGGGSPKDGDKQS